MVPQLTTCGGCGNEKVYCGCAMTVDLKSYGERLNRWPVTSVAEAREAHDAAIAAGPYGMSTWQGGTIRVNGRKVAFLSYNGRLWEPNKPGRDGRELNDDFSLKGNA